MEEEHRDAQMTKTVVSSTVVNKGGVEMTKGGWMWCRAGMKRREWECGSAGVREWECKRSWIELFAVEAQVEKDGIAKRWTINSPRKRTDALD